MQASSATHTEGRLDGVGGIEIFWQAWLPAGAPRAIVCLAHGAGEHSGRYGHVAAALTEAGYALYALDHRGHGKSGGDRALVDRMEHVLSDLTTLIDHAQRAHPDRDTYLLGHSMGGCISIAWSVRHQERIAGLLLSAPLAALESATPIMRFAAAVLSTILPKLPVFGVDASLVSRDPAVVADYENDPLVHHGKLPARTIAELAATIERFPSTAETLTVPMLVMHGTADELAPPSGSRMIFDRAASADKQYETYEDLFHEILNEPEQATVLADIVAWLDARA